MNTIEEYQQDESAGARLYLWRVALQVAGQRPVIGGGFKVTYWTEATNPLLSGTDIPRLTGPELRTAFISRRSVSTTTASGTSPIRPAGS